MPTHIPSTKNLAFKKVDFSNNLIAKKLYEIALGVLNGSYLGIADLLSVVADPLDNVLYPIGGLLYDSLIIAAVHNEVLAPNALYGIRSQQYEEAALRMAERINTMTRSCQDTVKFFPNAPLQEQVTLLTRTATSIFLPGQVLRGFQTLYAGTKNLKSFGMFKNPPLFENTVPDVLNPNLKWSPITKVDLPLMKGFHRCIYVITEEGELIIANRKLTSNLLSSSGTRLITEIHHHELGRLRPVMAAGELVVNDGKITLIDNMSGHYLPSGPHLQTVVQNVFKREGLTLGPYKESVWIQHFAAPTPKSTPLVPKSNSFSTTAVLIMNYALRNLGPNEREDGGLDHYAKTRVPLPSVPLQISANDPKNIVCQKIDSYFEDLIRNYSDLTKQLLRDMYYNDTNVKPSPALLLTQKMLANWQFVSNDTGIHFEMLVDQRLVSCPVLLRWNKIHEIAVHIGQVCEQLETVGIDTFMDNLSHFRKFTEQSAALAEKILIDAIPEAILIQDLSHINSNEVNITEDEKSFCVAMKNDFLSRKSYYLGDYISLSHRNHIDRLTEKDHHSFLQNPSVNKFLNNELAKFNNYSGFSISSTTSAKQTQPASEASMPSTTSLKNTQPANASRRPSTKPAKKTQSLVSSASHAQVRKSAEDEALRLAASNTESARKQQEKLALYKDLEKRIKSVETLKRLSCLLEEHSELICARSWYDFAQKNSKDLNKLRDYLEITVAFDSKHATALALLGFLYRDLPDQQLQLSRESYKQAAAAGNNFARLMLNRPSTAPDREGDGQYEAVKQSTENNKIKECIKTGCFDIFSGDSYLGFKGNAHSELVLMVREPTKNSQSTGALRSSNDYSDSRDRSRNSGVGVGYDVRVTQNNERTLNQETGRIPCTYQSSDSSGDFYKCSHLDVFLSGSAYNNTRTMTATNGRSSIQMEVVASRSDNNTISYSGGGHRDLMFVSDRSNGFDLGNPNGDAVDRNLAFRR